MTRFQFGGSAADVLVYTATVSGTSGLLRAMSAQAVTFWSAAATGGSQYTDLLTAAMAPATSITTDSSGLLPKFYGPDGVEDMYADGGVGVRVLVSFRAGVVTEIEAARDAATAAAQSINGGNIQATARKLADTGAVGDVTILTIGDSTAAAGQFPDTLLPAVQAMYPHRTLRQYVWNNTTHVYGSATTLVAGSGSTYINWYAGAVSGTVPESMLANWPPLAAAVQPDMVMVHYGHNYGATAAGGGYPNDATMDWVFKAQMLRLVLRIKDTVPNADVMVNSQNPYLTAGTRDGISSVRAQAIRSIAADLGCAYGPVCETFLATGSPSSYLGADLLHPNPAGAALTAAALLSQFRVNANLSPAARVVSPLLIPGKQLVLNADMSAFVTPPTLTNWTALLTTLTKETTIFETKAYSVKATSTAGAGNSQIYQSLPIKLVKGRVVTCATRVYVPSASGANCGRAQITGDGGTVSTTSGTLTNCTDTWVWVWATAYIPDAATFATFSIITGTGGTLTDVTFVDRASSVVGHMPRDCP